MSNGKRFSDKIKTHTFRNKRFRMVWRGGKTYHGKCDDPKDSGRCISVGINSDNLVTVGTVIHESIHAAFFDLDEAAVEAAERDIMRLFRRMGMKVTFDPR